MHFYSDIFNFRCAVGFRSHCEHEPRRLHSTADDKALPIILSHVNCGMARVYNSISLPANGLWPRFGFKNMQSHKDLTASHFNCLL